VKAVEELEINRKRDRSKIEATKQLESKRLKHDRLYCDYCNRDGYIDDDCFKRKQDEEAVDTVLP
jgi:hypothetical protein